MHGYSSSSESDDPRRPRPQAATTGSPQDQKKKKKKKPPPQQSINRIWKKFQNRKFNKALAVLPFHPVPPPAAPERANELLREGYDRAAEECRRKVRKIIQECRRINMRYRDAGFDLDWDLKYEKGHCLNSLGTTTFEVTRSSLHSSSAQIPKAVKRVHEIYEQPTFMEKVSGNDVKQGSLGDCWLMASLTALANLERGLKRICVEYDTRIGIYGFVFYRDGEWIYSIVDDKLYLKSPCWDSPSMQRDLLQQIDREDVENVYRMTYQTGSKALFFAQCKDQNETWLPLIEKAYAKAHGDYNSLAGGWIGEGLEDLSGGVTTELLTSDILDLDSFWDNELSKVNGEFLFGCSTGLLDGGYGDREGIAEGHAYVIIDARILKTGERLLKLRNPWGNIRKGMWEGAWSDGSKEWTAEVQQELGHNFGNDSVFWISYEDLLRKYQHFDRTRLFRDPDWRCCQRWIGVDVPWKPQYNEKFHIKLTQDSPLVFVLSQLDTRYFKGLHGQYNYRLHFRVHEQGRPGAVDYIVRSHGNYLMDRSVSVELPDMPAGNYTVFISVTGERNLHLPSVEDVVKRECKKRVENEKLAKVGYAYDLAHSKATTQLDEIGRQRKKKDQKKASDCRKNERRKQWERRHLNRDISKRQARKNTEKRERRRTEQIVKSEVETEATKEEAKKEVEAKDEIEIDEVVTGKKAKNCAVQAERGSVVSGEDKSRKDVQSSAAGKPSQAVGVPTKTDGDSADQKSNNGDFEEAGDEPPDAGTPESGSIDDSTEPTTSPKDTPKSEKSIIVESTQINKEPVPSVDGLPPTSGSELTTSIRPQVVYDSENDSSDSPIEDWEELYSSDDMTRKPRAQNLQQSFVPESRYESDDEALPDPWNAICVVGFRVYSKDEGLELRVVMEGGELLEGGMGEKGEADLDNAQTNAGGARGGKTTDPTAKEDGFAPYATVVRKGGDEFEEITRMAGKSANDTNHRAAESSFEKTPNVILPILEATVEENADDDFKLGFSK